MRRTSGGRGRTSRSRAACAWTSPSSATPRFDNPPSNALTFRDEGGNAVKYNTGALPKASPLWSPRVGFNWDVFGNNTTQVRGGTGVFTGKPAYVWISNQIGNTGHADRLHGGAHEFDRVPVQPEPRQVQAGHGDRRAARPASTSR